MHPSGGQGIKWKLFTESLDSQPHPNTSISLSNSAGHVRLSLGKSLSGGEGAGPSREIGGGMDRKRRQKRYRRLDRAEWEAAEMGGTGAKTQAADSARSTDETEAFHRIMAENASFPNGRGRLRIQDAAGTTICIVYYGIACVRYNHEKRFLSNFRKTRISRRDSGKPS